MPQINRHEPRRAWKLAAVYFVVCWIIALSSGALGTLNDPFAGGLGTDPGFWAFALATSVAAYVGYWVIWPMGTFTADRSDDRREAVLFGIVHGLSEGVLYVAIWSIIDDRITSGAWTLIASVLAIAAYNGVWRTFVWDVFVTPPHNKPAWNSRKVLFVHLPVTTMALAHLTAYRSEAVFLLFQVIALVGAAVYMRFPSPRQTEGKPSARPLASK